MMFQADGKQVASKSQMYVFSKGLPFNLTVVTGNSGSHKEEDILSFLDNRLMHWRRTRRWEIFLLDAYAPGLADNVQRFCWSRGYALITHGGGASGVAQTNGADHHLHCRKRFIKLQHDRMIKKARVQCGGMADWLREENIDIMIEVVSGEKLHLQACDGYKHTGTTVAFDKREDDLICREAKRF